MHEHLIQAREAAELARANLRAALNAAGAVESMVILPMIERVATLQRDIDAICHALSADGRA